MEDTRDTVLNPSDQIEFLATARRRFARAVSDESDIRKEAKTDLQFVAGDQWDSNTKQDRMAESRPALTFNKLPSFVQQVANEARQNKPQPKVNPVGAGADADTAKVINGILRHIQYRSKADIAYDTALEYAASCGFGYFRLTTEYCKPDGFEQEIVIKAVADPFSVYGVMLPNALGRKPEYAFIVDRISRDEFKRRFPKSKAVSLNFEVNPDLTDGGWFGDEDVQLAEYWYVVYERKKLLLLPDGSKQYSDAPLPPGVKALAFRDVEIPSVKQCLTNGLECLEETDWLGKEIPIYGCYGKQTVVDGKLKLFSLIHFLRDPQQLFNFYKSGIAEKIGLSNRVPYIGYKGQFEDEKWRDANVRNYAYLEVEPVMINGAPAPLPQRQPLEEQIQALSMAAMSESDDMKAIVGIYDASLGNRSNETSGIAIGRRQQQASITNMHFSDNLMRAEWAGCLAMIELIPQIYGEPGRAIRIIGEDESHKIVTLNQPYVDENGKPHLYALDAGEYDVVVTTGPSYTTARQEGADTLSQIIQAVPQAFPLLGDMWVGDLDYTWAEEAAKRLKKALLPPQLQEDQGNMQIPPQIQQQMKQGEQMIQQLTAALHQLQNEIDTKQVEMSSRERIAAMQEETKRTIALATINSREGQVLLEQELAVAHKAVDQAHDATMQQGEQIHQAQQNAQAQQAQAAQQQQAQQAAQQQQAQQPQQGQK